MLFILINSVSTGFTVWMSEKNPQIIYCIFVIFYKSLIKVSKLPCISRLVKDNSIYNNVFSNSIHWFLHRETKYTQIPNRKYSILRQYEEQVIEQPSPSACNNAVTSGTICKRKELLYIPPPLNSHLHHDGHKLPLINQSASSCVPRPKNKDWMSLPNTCCFSVFSFTQFF